MKSKISTFRPFDFKNIFIDGSSYHKVLQESVNVFFIHSLKEDVVALKLPLPPHRKTVNDFMFVTKGTAQRHLDIDERVLRENDFLLVPKLVVSTTDFFSSDLEGYYCHFSDDFVGANSFLFDWQTNPLIAKQIKLPEDTAGRLGMLLQAAVGLYNKRHSKLNHLIPYYLNTVLIEVYAEALDQSSLIKSDKKKQLTNKYLKLVNANFHKSWSMADYAGLLCVSPNHLNKTVKSCTNKTAQEIHNQIILQEAKVQLLQTDQSIGEIAFNLGFNDVSYFGKFFKKHFHISPLE